MTYCSKESCPNCRKYPRVLAQREKKAVELDDARRNGKSCVQLEKELAAIEVRLQPLQLHIDWLKENRPTIDAITDQLCWGRLNDTIQLIIDFGKIYASDSRACKTLVFTLYRNSPQDVACGRRFTEYIDNWFRGSSCGITTIRVFEYLLSSTSIFAGIKHLWVHCDTGNGNRGYELIKFFSRCWSRFELAPEWASYCPVHAHSPCDAHIGKLAQAVDPIKCEGRIIELVEFAEVSTQLPNTHAFVYDDGIDNEDTIFVDENIHQTLVAPRKPSGISLVGHIQCRWQLSNGDYFAEDDVVRVRRPPFASRSSCIALSSLWSEGRLV